MGTTDTSRGPSTSGYVRGPSCSLYLPAASKALFVSPSNAAIPTGLGTGEFYIDQRFAPIGNVDPFCWGLQDSTDASNYFAFMRFETNNPVGKGRIRFNAKDGTNTIDLIVNLTTDAASGSSAKWWRFLGGYAYSLRREGNVWTLAIANDEGDQVSVSQNDAASAAFNWGAFAARTNARFRFGSYRSSDNPDMHLGPVRFFKPSSTLAAVTGTLDTDRLAELLRNPSILDGLSWSDKQGWGDVKTSAGADLDHEGRVTLVTSGGSEPRLYESYAGTLYLSATQTGSPTGSAYIYPRFHQPAKRPQFPHAREYRPAYLELASGDVLKPVCLGDQNEDSKFGHVTLDSSGRYAAPVVMVSTYGRWMDSTESGAARKKQTVARDFAGWENHRGTVAVELAAGLIQFHSYHHEAVTGSPSAGDYKAPHCHLTHDSDGEAFTDVLWPLDDLIDWTLAYAGNDTQYRLGESAYLAARQIDTDYAVCAVRLRDTQSARAACISVYYATPGSPPQTNRIILTAAPTPATQEVKGLLPEGVCNLDNAGLFAACFHARMVDNVGTSLGSFGTMCFIGASADDLDAGAGWFCPGTGEPLDGSGASSLTAGSININTHRDKFNLYHPNDGQSDGDGDHAETREVMDWNDGNGYVLSSYHVDYGALDTAAGSHVVDGHVFITTRIDAGSKLKSDVSLVDMFAWFEAEESTAEARVRYWQSIPLDGGALVVLYCRGQTGLSQGTHYAGFSNHYGTAIRGLYFGDRTRLDRFVQLANGADLFNITDHTGLLSCKPHRIHSAAGHPRAFAVEAFYSVGDSTYGNTSQFVISIADEVVEAANLFRATYARGARGRSRARTRAALVGR